MPKHKPEGHNQSASGVSIVRELVAYLMLSLPGASAIGQDPALLVYSTVPGAKASDQYAVAVRPAQNKDNWQKSFAHITRCKNGIRGENGYFPHLSGWTHTYINIEMGGPVEIAIKKVNGQPIRKAVARPQRKVRSCVVRDGYAYVTLDKPCQVSVDIDGQMEEHDTGKGYKGPPIHSLTLFANPLIRNRPSPEDPTVLAVKPGDAVPSNGTWKTLYFLPGIHDIGVAFPLHAARNYYIPGDAIVYGSMSNHEQWDHGHDIRIFGYGTLSMARIAHPNYASPRPLRADLHNSIRIVGARNSSVEGITIADPAYHSLMLIDGHHPEQPTNIRWTKIIGWRVNGDGINPFENCLIEDCFLRTQDDSTYANGRGIRRVTYWNDFNGSTFVLSSLPNRKLIIEDCDVIYARAGWDEWSGGRLFNMRGEGKGSCGAGVVFQNIRVEDPRPTLQHFLIAMQGLPPYLDSTQIRGPGHLAGLVFKDIEIAASSVLGQPDILWGAPDAKIMQLTFDNVTIGGKKISSMNDFKHNDEVESLIFK